MNNTILIVDDAPLIRMLLRNILEMNGLEIAAEAKNGVEAVEKYIRHRPGLTIMDINMPAKDGVTAALEILEHDSEANIVMCSSAVSEDDLVASAKLAGAKGVLMKPFTIETVLDVVGRFQNINREDYLRENSSGFYY